MGGGITKLMFWKLNYITNKKGTNLGKQNLI